MKNVNLFAVAVLLLMTSCSPKVVTHLTKTYPDIIPADSVYVIGLGETVPNTAETIGRVSVVDRGMSANCNYDRVLYLAQEATGKNGGNGLVITNHLRPSFWGSSCHQISGLMLRLTDKGVDTLKANPLQDMIDLELLVVKEREQSRRVPASTFEASIGYGWVTSTLYDITGAVLGNNGGLEWKLSYEYAWNSGWGIGVQYSGYRTGFHGGDNMLLSYIAPEWVVRTKFDRWILKCGLGIGLFLYHEPFYNACGMGVHATVGIEYMLSAHWGLGFSLNTINGSLPDRSEIKLKNNERSGITRFNLLGGLRYYF